MSIFILIVSLHLEVGRFSSRFFVVFFVLEVDDGEMVFFPITCAQCAATNDINPSG